MEANVLHYNYTFAFGFANGCFFHYELCQCVGRTIKLCAIINILHDNFHNAYRLSNLPFKLSSWYQSAGYMKCLQVSVNACLMPPFPLFI
jgi:hypothetical protein